MKILFITHFFLPDHLGGTEILTYDIAKSLQNMGHTVQVICAEDWESALDYQPEISVDEYQGIPVQRLHFNWTKAPDVFRYLYNNPKIYSYFAQYLDQYQPDIVHITSCYSFSASVITATQEKNIPVILSATDFWFLCARNTLLHTNGELCDGPQDPWECARCLVTNSKFDHFLDKVVPSSIERSVVKRISKIPTITNRPGFRGMLGDWPDRFKFLFNTLNSVPVIITASHFLREKFIQFGVNADKILFSSYGLDTSWARGYETKTQSDQLRLGFIGQILPMKGAHLLIKAVTSLPKNNRLQLKIYGNLDKDAQYGHKLRQLARGDQRISFKGTFKNSRMGEVLSEIDALVVPSTWYDFPLVVPSALATRTPVIATNLPGMNEQIRHKENGLLFERGDWHKLRKQINLFLDDRGLLEKLRNNIQPIKTTDQMGKEFEKIYESQLSTL